MNLHQCRLVSWHHFALVFAVRFFIYPTANKWLILREAIKRYAIVTFYRHITLAYADTRNRDRSILKMFPFPSLLTILSLLFSTSRTISWWPTTLCRTGWVLPPLSVCPLLCQSVRHCVRLCWVLVSFCTAMAVNGSDLTSQMDADGTGKNFARI